MRCITCYYCEGSFLSKAVERAVAHVVYFKQKSIREAVYTSCESGGTNKQKHDQPSSWCQEQDYNTRKRELHGHGIFVCNVGNIVHPTPTLRSHFSLSPVRRGLRGAYTATVQLLHCCTLTIHYTMLQYITPCYNTLHHVVHLIRVCFLSHFFHRTDEAFTTLQSAVETFQSLTDNYGML